MNSTINETEITSIIKQKKVLDLILLLRQGFDPNHVIEGRPIITLPMTSEADDTDMHMIEILLEHGADPNARTPLFPWGDAAKDCSILMYAMENCRKVEVLRMLLEKGANPNEIYPNWHYSLLYRIIQVYVNGVNRQSKIRIPFENKELIYEICRLFLKYGVDRSLKNDDGTTAVDALLGHEQMLVDDSHYKLFLRAVQFGN